MGVTPRNRRVEWLDRMVILASLSEDLPRPVARIRDLVDDLAARRMELDAPPPACIEYFDGDTRARTQAVRRAVRRLSTESLLQTTLGHSRASDRDLVEHFRITSEGWRWLVDGGQSERVDTVRQLRLQFAGMCDHAEPVSGCLACEGFVKAGGSFEEKTADLQELAREKDRRRWDGDEGVD